MEREPTEGPGDARAGPGLGDGLAEGAGLGGRVDARFVRAVGGVAGDLDLPHPDDGVEGEEAVADEGGPGGVCLIRRGQTRRQEQGRCEDGEGLDESVRYSKLDGRLKQPLVITSRRSKIRDIGRVNGRSGGAAGVGSGVCPLGAHCHTNHCCRDPCEPATLPPRAAASASESLGMLSIHAICLPWLLCWMFRFSGSVSSQSRLWPSLCRSRWRFLVAQLQLVLFRKPVQHHGDQRAAHAIVRDAQRLARDRSRSVR